MSTVSSTIGIEKYLDAIISHPVKLSQDLSDLGPTLRLQLLFSMCNVASQKVESNLYSWATEVFRNLSNIYDMSMLDDLDIKGNGPRIYAKIPHIAKE